MSGSFYSLQLFKCSLLHRKDSQKKKKNNPLHGNGFTVPFPENFIKVFCQTIQNHHIFIRLKCTILARNPKEPK